MTAAAAKFAGRLNQHTRCVGRSDGCCTTHTANTRAQSIQNHKINSTSCAAMLQATPASR
jgi:hypothetical protein